MSPPVRRLLPVSPTPRVSLGLPPRYERDRYGAPGLGCARVDRTVLRSLQNLPVRGSWSRSETAEASVSSQAQ